MGMFVKDKNKDKGTISGEGAHVISSCRRCAPGETDFDIHIQSVSTKPETRVTINAKKRPKFLSFDAAYWETQFKKDFLSELQRVLATYR
jgi:hypothetical protein